MRDIQVIREHAWGSVCTPFSLAPVRALATAASALILTDYLAGRPCVGDNATMNSFGQLGRTRALLTGRLVTWGRKPWLASRFGAAFHET